MIEFRALPLRTGMAGSTGSGKATADVIRIYALVEVGQVATLTGLGRTGKPVTGVAGIALHLSMCAHQGKFCAYRVVELCALPLRRCVALRAVFWKARARMVGVRRAVEGRQVTPFAGLRRSGESAIDVALRALGFHVCACERELAQSMIVGRTLPLCSRMTLSAIARKVRGHVGGIGGLGEGIQVTPFASLRRSGEPARHVTGTALYGHMGTGQSKFSSCRVIKRCPLPLNTCVTNGAIPGEPGLYMVRVSSGIKVLAVAVDVLGRRSDIPPSNMAVRAGQTRMCTLNDEAGNRCMVELCTSPGIRGVALITLDRDPGRGVGWVLRTIEIFGVACDAVRAQTTEHPGGRSLMAALAGRDAVSPNQREAVGMFARLLDCEAPAFHGVTLFAVPPKLPAVEVGVTGGALLADIAEDLLDMAGRALDILVQAEQRPFGLCVVIELRLGPNRLPGRSGMATATGNLKRSMWIGSAGSHLRWHLTCHHGCQAESGQKARENIHRWHSSH